MSDNLEWYKIAHERMLATLERIQRETHQVITEFAPKMRAALEVKPRQDGTPQFTAEATVEAKTPIFDPTTLTWTAGKFGEWAFAKNKDGSEKLEVAPFLKSIIDAKGKLTVGDYIYTYNVNKAEGRFLSRIIVKNK